VLVVGVGNSGGEIASELAGAGLAVDISVRSGANVVPRQLAGIPVQYLAHWLLKLPKPLQGAVIAAVRRLVELRRGPSPLPPAGQGPLEAIPLIGFHLVDAINAGRVGMRPGVARLTGDGAVFGDASEGRYDTIVLATGYRAALAPLGELVRRDAKGFALRTGRVVSADQPDLYFVGHLYDASGALNNIARDSGVAADAIARSLSAEKRGEAAESLRSRRQGRDRPSRGRSPGSRS
jgi:cation diffusion facilitator CzcD-associated flavoprotein CzcO